jgi:hypothetical protein
MHQLRISIISISFVMVSPKKKEIQNVMTVKIPNRPKIEYREMEPNPFDCKYP